MMYNDFIKDMTNLKNLRKFLKKAESEVNKENAHVKQRNKMNKEYMKPYDERKILEKQLEELSIC